MTKPTPLQIAERTGDRGPGLAISPRRDLRREAPPPDRQAQELWFLLARRNWSSVVLVPADEGTSTSGLAASLAAVGRWLRDGAASAIVDQPLDSESARRVASILEATRQGGGAPLELIVAIQPVLTEPLGLTVAWAADAVILCVEKNRTRLAAARRTIELIGRERIASCILLRPGA